MEGKKYFENYWTTETAKKIHLLYSKQLSRINIHPHINPTKSTTSNHFTFPPADWRSIIFPSRFHWWRLSFRNRWKSRNLRLGEDPNTRFTDTGTDFLNETSKCTAGSGFRVAGGLENERSANGADEILHFGGAKRGRELWVRVQWVAFDRWESEK